MSVWNSRSGEKHHSLLSTGPGTSLTFTCIKSECPAQAWMGGRGARVSNVWCIISSNNIIYCWLCIFINDLYTTDHLWYCASAILRNVFLRRYQVLKLNIFWLDFRSGFTEKNILGCGRDFVRLGALFLSTAYWNLVEDVRRNLITDWQGFSDVLRNQWLRSSQIRSVGLAWYIKKKTGVWKLCFISFFDRNKTFHTFQLLTFSEIFDPHADGKKIAC